MKEGGGKNLRGWSLFSQYLLRYLSVPPAVGCSPFVGDARNVGQRSLAFSFSDLELFYTVNSTRACCVGLTWVTIDTPSPPETLPTPLPGRPRPFFLLTRFCCHFCFCFLLFQCIEIWGINPRTDAPPWSSSSSPSCRSPNANAEFDHDHDCWSDHAPASGGVGGGGGGGFDPESIDGGLSGSPGLETYSGGGGCGGSAGGAFEVQVDGMGVSIPWLPPKYVQWLSQRRKVKREINNMGRVGGHRNVLELLSVLELLQDSKSTLFLILELVTGGELLDHIRLAGEGESRAGVGGLTGKAKVASALRAEGAAQRYFSQLLSGLAYCHRRGVCHRRVVLFAVYTVFLFFPSFLRVCAGLPVHRGHARARAESEIMLYVRLVSNEHLLVLVEWQGLEWPLP